MDILFVFTFFTLWTALEAYCPPGSTAYSKDCFLFVDEPRTWDEANAYCQQRNSSLLAIHSQNIQSYIETQLNERSNWTRSWTGLVLRDSSWHWIATNKDVYYHGCYQDDSKQPTLTFVMSQSKDVTPTSCVEDCKKDNYYYAGVKFENNTPICRCDYHFAPGMLYDSDDHCSMPCPSDFIQSCGGDGEQRVYSTTSLYSNWGAGAPDNVRGNQHCVTLRYPSTDLGDRYWNDRECDIPHDYICQLKDSDVNTCKEDYHVYIPELQQCFYLSYSHLYTEMVSAEVARNACIALNGDLVALDNPQLMEYLVPHLKETFYWIGLSNEKWMWQEKLHEPIAYSNWVYPGLAPYAIYKKCSALNMDSNYHWSPEHCEQSMKFICQFESKTVSGHDVFHISKTTLIFSPILLLGLSCFS